MISEAACQIFALATGAGRDTSRSEILELAAQLRVSEINAIIRDLHRHGVDLKRQAYGLMDMVGYLSDEVRRRAEFLEQQHANRDDG